MAAVPWLFAAPASVCCCVSNGKVEPIWAVRRWSSTRATSLRSRLMGANVLIMAGGTGGHVFPALACAREFQSRGYTVHWLGTPRGIENELVPNAGLPLHLINVSGLRGKSKLSLLKAPFVLLKAIWQARKIIRQLQPVC